MLRKDGMEKERFNELNPTAKQKKTYVEECLPSSDKPVIAATDYMRAYPSKLELLLKRLITLLELMVMEEVIQGRNFENFLK